MLEDSGFVFSFYKLLLYTFSTKIMQCNYFMWADHHQRDILDIYIYTYLDLYTLHTIYKNTFCDFFFFLFIMAVCSPVQKRCLV